MKRFLLLFSFSFFSTSNAVELNKEIKKVSINGENGGTLSGKEWDSKCLTNIKKKKVIFYIDPDEKDKNDYFTELLKYKKTLQTDNILSYAIVNTKAAWKPTVIIKKVLENKQKKYPYTTYIMDNTKFLVKEWGLPDDEAICLIIDETGKTVFFKAGVMNETDIELFFKILDKS